MDPIYVTISYVCKLIVTWMMMTSPDFDVCGVVTEANFYQS
jgi:hypothetical protein